METFELGGDPPVRVVLRTSGQARRYSLRVSRLDGRVTLTIPRGASRAAALDFARQKAGWLRAKLSERPVDVKVDIGTELSVDGVPLTLRHGPRSCLLPEAGRFEIRRDSRSVPMAAAVLLREHARTRVSVAAQGFGAALGRHPSRITLRDTRSRWGSCSAAGGLMLSWRLVLAPPEVLDYVVAHEVAHLAEMNHGPRFWATVERLWPDYRAHRAWLRRHGEDLHRFRFDD